MKQTAVEWYEKQIFNLQIQLEKKEISLGEYAVKRVELFKQAKAMHKEQIIEAYKADCDTLGHTNAFNVAAEQYYNETFKSESFCNCPKGKGIDFDENQKAYCIDCGKNINL